MNLGGSMARKRALFGCERVWCFCLCACLVYLKCSRGVTLLTPNAIESSKSHVGFVWFKVVRNLGRFVKLVIRTSEKNVARFWKVMHVFWKRWCTFVLPETLYIRQNGAPIIQTNDAFFRLPPIAPPKVMRGFHWSATQRSNAETKWTCQPGDRWCLSEEVSCNPAIHNRLSKSYV